MGLVIVAIVAGFFRSRAVRTGATDSINYSLPALGIVVIPTARGRRG